MKASEYLKFDNLLYSAFAFFVLVSSGGAYPQTGRVTFLYAGVIATSIACILHMRIVKVSREALFSWILILVAFCLLLGIRGEWFSNDNENHVLYKIFFVLPILVAMGAKKYGEVMAVYIRVFNGLLWLSLAGVALATIDSDAFQLMQYTGKYSGVTTTYFFIEDVTVREFYGLAFIKSADITRGFFRNQGIFWEPGVLSFFICWFYIIKNCYLKDTRMNWLYFLVEATTLSAAGILIFAAFAGYAKFLHGKSQRNMREFLVIGIILVVVIIVLSQSENVINSFLGIWGGVFGRDFQNEASAVTRWRDFYYGIMAAMDRPLWGHGWDFKNYDSVLLVEVNSGKPGEWGGITNSIVAVFYKYGIFYWLLYMYLLWRWSFRIAENSPWGIMLFLGFTLTLMHEPLDSSIIIMSFLCYPPPAQRPVRATGVLPENKPVYI